MGSKKLLTRESQKARFSRQLESRSSLLTEKGVPEEKLARDPHVKRFKARIRQVDKAIARIAFLDKQTEELREKKERKIAEAATRRAEMIAGTLQKKTKEKQEEPQPAKKGKGQAKAPQKTKKEPKKK
ncbi:MAG: hypothetical protein AB1646_24465 [Thermodesulfobacteriota bacterium]